MNRALVVCLGASLVDDVYRFHHPPVGETSNPADFQRTAGGVARNVAHHLAQLGIGVELVTHFGADPEGYWLRGECTKVGIGLANSYISSSPTGRYSAFLTPKGDLLTAASVSTLEKEITPAHLQSISETLKTASILVADCNLSLECLQWLTAFSRLHSLTLILEPVSVHKVLRLADTDLHGVWLITPGAEEAKALGGSRHILESGVQHLWLRKGKDGSSWVQAGEEIEIQAPHVNLIDSTGAGDAALAGWIYAWLLGKDHPEAVRYGHAIATLILEQMGATRPTLNAALLENRFRELYTV